MAKGRAHAVTFAREGASVVLTDICENLPTVSYDLSTRSDLDETVALVEAAGGKAVSSVADVRDGAALDALVALGLDRFGRIDIVCANAGIAGRWSALGVSRAEFDEMVSVS